MKRTQAEEKLEVMRQQERAIEQQIAELTEQLLMTRGAVQMLDFLLASEEEQEGVNNG